MQAFLPPLPLHTAPKTPSHSQKKVIYRTSPKATLPHPKSPSPPPTPSSLQSHISVAHAALDISGQILSKYFRQSLPPTFKSDQTPVTLADKEAEAAIRSTILSNFPSHAIIGEELNPNSEHAAEYVWIIDPIDGTRAFITGKPTFCTLLALVHNGQPVLGIIDQPINRERWVGVEGCTTYNGQNVKVRKTPAVQDCVVCATTPDMFIGLEGLAFRELKKKVRNVVWGGDAYSYAMVAMGCADVVVEADLKIWDIMAVIMVIRGAGGEIRDWEGRDIGEIAGWDGKVVAGENCGQVLKVLGTVFESDIGVGCTPVSRGLGGYIEEVESLGGWAEVDGVRIHSSRSEGLEVEIKGWGAGVEEMVRRELGRGKVVVEMNGGGLAELEAGLREVREKRKTEGEEIVKDVARRVENVKELLQEIEERGAEVGVWEHLRLLQMTLMGGEEIGLRLVELADVVKEGVWADVEGDAAVAQLGVLVREEMTKVRDLCAGIR